ncbi:MAG: superoxide dismutase [Gemmataceae bacterium]|jgi:Fe-Mn family superoxide dismutase|nr:superoxide dismutase [Planctomycetota bacterium]
MTFTLPTLPYAHDALEKAIDKTTMEIHHGRHHKAYVDNLNAAIQGRSEFDGQSIEAILAKAATLPDDIRQKVINNGGGHANHTLFWETMSPNGGGDPSGVLADAITSTFGDLATLKQKVKEAALARFGSGWSWVVVSGGKLEILSTANQDSPLMHGKTPILGVDVWEHAYYLRYQNKRADYVDAFWHVINWSDVAARFQKAGH